MFLDQINRPTFLIATLLWVTPVMLLPPTGAFDLPPWVLIFVFPVSAIFIGLPQFAMLICVYASKHQENRVAAVMISIVALIVYLIWQSQIDFLSGSNDVFSLLAIQFIIAACAWGVYGFIHYLRDKYDGLP